MKKPCLHCSIADLITSTPAFKHMSKKAILNRLMEVAGDMISGISNHKERAEMYEYWGELMITIMDEIEQGNYK